MSAWTTPSAERAFDHLLAVVGSRARDIGPGALTSHWPLVGSRARGRIVVLGQAVFGWIPSWTAADVVDPSGRRRVLLDSIAVFADRDDPMDWIADHPVRNSPFWSTVRRVAAGLYGTSDDWFADIAWANLYPIAPNDRKANPEGVLRSVQDGPNADFIAALVEDLQPAVVLVLAGPFWRPFASRFPVPTSGIEGPLIAKGRIDGRSWIVGMHPGGAQRRGWPAAAYAELILRRLQD